MAEIERVTIKVINGYNLMLTAGEIKKLRELFCKVAFAEKDAVSAHRHRELLKLAPWAHDMMAVCDKYLHEWMEEACE